MNIVITVPVAFTGKDVQSKSWPKIREALISNATECIREEINSAVAKIRKQQ